MTRAIIFDFGNVVGFFSHLRAATNLLSLAGKKVSPERLRDFLFFEPSEQASPNSSLEVGELAAAEFIAMLRDRLAAPRSVSDEQLARAFSDIFEPNDAVVDLIRRLPPDYRLLLASNTNQLHFDHFAVQFQDVLQRFDALVLSHQVHHRKPAREFYVACERHAGCERSQCVFVDDMPRNVESARQYGFQTIQYTAATDLQRELLKVGVRAYPQTESA